MKLSDITPEQEATVEVLMNYGWALTHIYGDSLLNMSKRIHNEDVMVFVGNDGLITPPRTHNTMVAQANLFDIEKDNGKKLFHHTAGFRRTD